MIALLAVLAAAPLPGAALVADGLQGGLSSARVGEWATFELVGSGSPYFWRIAAVAEEKDDEGRPAVWLELELGAHPAMRAPMAQLKLRVARGAGLDAKGVSRAFVAFGADRPRELDPAQLPRFFASPARGAPARPLAGEVHLVRGHETRLMTYGGTVTATPVELRFRQTVVKRFWVSLEVPLLGLARLELPAIGYSLEAREWGIGAKPRLPPVDLGAARIRMEGYDAAELP